MIRCEKRVRSELKQKNHLLFLYGEKSSFNYCLRKKIHEKNRLLKSLLNIFRKMLKHHVMLKQDKKNHSNFDR